MRKFFKRKSLYFALVILLLGGWYARARYEASQKPPEYEIVKVVRGNLTQTVEATGKIQSVSDLSLKFEASGTIERMYVTAGETVRTGTVLASLRQADLNAAVAAAEANLNQKLTGATEQDIQYYQAAVASAEAALEEAKADANGLFTTSSMSEGGRIVSSVYEATVPILQTSLTKLDDGLTQADNILGFDNVFANDSFRSTLSSLDMNKLNAAITLYSQTKIKIAAAHAAAGALTTASARASIDKGLVATEEALASTNQLLSLVSAVLRATAPSGQLPQATLDAKKTTIETARAAIAAQYASVVTQKEVIADAKSSVQIKQAAYDQAVANLNAKILPPREVDVAYYRAALAQALANRDKTVLRAPQSGVVTDVPKKAGEFISTAETAVKLLSPHYEIKVDIPETDVAKLSLGQAVAITLDAFGDDVAFSGSVAQVDPNSTEIQDVVYYKVTVRLMDTERPIKPGMTANVSIATGERKEALYIPLRTVRSRLDNTKYVRVLVGGVEKEVAITIGLKADEGRAEVLSGLEEGDAVIVSVKGK